MCVKLAWGILAHWKIDFWCYYESKSGDINEFIVCSGHDLGDPSEKDIDKKKLTKKCARMPRIFKNGH